MRFDEFFDVLSDFLSDPVINVRVTNTNYTDYLEQQLAESQKELNSLRSNIRALQDRYVHECNMTMKLKDELQNVKDGFRK